uniref:Saccharopine dehydrogenase NADP binding domain-containing protein n=1 Tax=Bionectria ochroleuca TaxID=29856 RepID=A0A8H7K304_BIOOC
MPAIDLGGRKYGIVVVGATGFTGTLISTYIAANLPTDLKWAITGRSQARLDKLAAKLREDYPDRVQPELEVVSPDDAKTLGEVIGKAKVCISIVLYHEDGEKVVRACIEQRTDYVDSAAVPNLFKEWIEKYHQQAQQNGVALIHSCGVMSAEMDLFAIHGAEQIARKWSAKMGSMTLRAEDQGANVSGGTMRTMISFAEAGPKAMAAAGDPSFLTPVPYTKPIQAQSGSHKHPVLGLLASSSPTADQARALINRTWGLLGGPEGSWGPNFQYNEYERAPSYLGAVGQRFRCYIIVTMLSLVQYPWFKNLLMRSAPESGAGPTEEQRKAMPFAAAAFIEADPAVKENRGKGCLINFSYKDGAYPLSALITSQAAATLLYDRHLPAGIKGGCLTAGVLGPDFVKRAKQGGLEIETTMIEN